MMIVLDIMSKVNTVKSFIDLFKKDTRLNMLIDRSIENRLRSVIESTTEYCYYRFQEDVKKEVVIDILNNTNIIQSIYDCLFIKNFKWKDEFDLSGYGIDRDTQKRFVEFFFYTLQNNLHKDLEIRRIFRETGVYLEIDEIYDMTKEIYTKVDNISKTINNIKDISSQYDNQNDVRIKFYLHNKIDCCNKMKSLSIDDIPKSDEIRQLTNDILDITEKIKAVEILENVPVKNNDYLKSNNFNKKPVKIANDTKDYIVCVLDKIYDKHIDYDTFFCLGGLKKNIYEIGNDPGYEGTDKEVHKNNLLINLQISCFIYYAYLNMINDFKDYKIVPLIVSNQGNIKNSNLKVKLKFPKMCNIFTSPSLGLAIHSSAAKYKNKRLIESFLCPIKDSNVTQYNNDNNYHNIRKCHIKHDDIYDDIKEKITIEKMMNFNMFVENDFKILEFEFDYICPNENKSFPVYLLIKMSSNVEINYKIISDHKINKPIGTLYYNI